MMAESKISTDSSGDEEAGDDEEDSTDSSEDGEQGPCRKRRRLNAGNEICTDQGASPRESSDETDTILQKRTKSDPLSDLTKDQRVVLYTLFLCDHGFFAVYLDDNVTMGDIDVRRTLIELQERGLVMRYRDRVGINRDRRKEIVRSYRENCLLSDVDRDFFLQVASDQSLTSYIAYYPRPSTDTEESGDVPITLMRLVMEGRGQDIVWDILESADKYTHKEFADVEFQKFVQEWCRLRNLDPMPWADEISYGEAVRFLSVYTILKTFQKGLWVQC